MPGHRESYADLPYDFVAPEKEHQTAAGQILKRWRETRTAQAMPHLLLDSSGEVIDAEFARLLRKRTDPDMTLSE